MEAPSNEMIIPFKIPKVQCFDYTIHSDPFLFIIRIINSYKMIEFLIDKFTFICEEILLFHWRWKLILVI